jgi:site-specific DNA recombinase
MKEQKNIGIWIRVSTEKQVDDESPEHHEKRARNYAEAKGWNVVTVYRLDALSGKSIMDYQETKRMLKDIQSGAISGIIFSKLARLARNTKELLEISEIFRSNTADLISLAEAIDTSSPAGRLFFTVIAAMAQWEREEIADRVAASVPIRAKMGKPLGGAAPFGYAWEEKELVINEKEAPVRKLMYEIYKKTKRIKATATELNASGYRTRNGSKFTGTTVERLITDTIAKGIRRANYTKSIGEGKKWVVKPESEWIETQCPAIVSAELWDECNAILEKSVTRRIANGPRPVFLLSGFVYCSCGKKMYVYNNNKDYKCTPCKRKITVQDLDEIYHTQLKSFFLVDADDNSIAEKSDMLMSEKQILLSTMKEEYNKLKKRLEIQWNFRVDGELSKDDFQRFYQPVQEQLRQMEGEIPQIEAEIDFLKIQYLSSETLMEEAKDLYNNWLHLPFEEKRSIIETITERIDIQKDTINISLSYLPRTHHSLEIPREGNASVPLWLLQSS